MKSILYSSILLLVVVTLSTNTEDPKTKFCDSEESVSRAFIAGNEIFFGDDKSYWKMNANDFSISNKETIEEIFGESIKFKRITTALHFGQMSCDENCDEIKKSRDLLLVIGTIDDEGTNTNYKAYRTRVNSYPTAVENESEMPWGLHTEAKLKGGEFWPQSDYITYEGMTFEENTKWVYMADTEGEDDTPFVRFRQLGRSGTFETNFNRYINQSRIYTGLVDWKGEVYALAENKFYWFNFNSSTPTLDNNEFSAKRFFNCDDKSPLKDIITTTPSDENNSTDGNTTDAPTPTTSREDEDEDTTKGSVQTTNSVTVTKRSESGKGWFLWLIIIAIIVILIVLIICCLFCCKKSGDKPEKSRIDVEKSKPDSQIVSEGDSNVKKDSKVSESGEEITGGPNGLNKSSSKTGLSVGQPKSEIESLASVRSKTD